jgi:hypothetical protein
METKVPPGTVDGSVAAGPNTVALGPPSADVVRNSVDAKEIQVAENNEEKEIGLEKTSEDGAAANIVDWDGPDDPNYPMNWTNMRKFKNISVICYCTFLT